MRKIKSRKKRRLMNQLETRKRELDKHHLEQRKAKLEEELQAIEEKMKTLTQ